MAHPATLASRAFGYMVIIALTWAPLGPAVAQVQGDPPVIPPAQPARSQEEEKKDDPADSAEQEKQEEEQTSEQTAESADDVTAQLEEAAGDEKAEGEEAAAEEVTEEKEQIQATEESGDSVTAQIQETKEIPAGLFPHAPISDLYRLWKPGRDRFAETTGIEVGTAYTTLLQVATRGDRRRDAWSGDIDLFGRWRFVNKGETNTGTIGFLAEQRHRFADIPPSQLGSNIGSLWGTTRGFNTQDAALVQLWWEQYLLDDRLCLTAGKIDPANYYNGNRFQSQNIFFLNRAFSGNPARKFPDNGLGLNARVAPTGKWYLSFGVHDVNGRRNTSGFSDLDADELFYAGEIGFSPTIEGLGSGRYRFTAWYSTGGEATGGDSGPGFAFSFDQDLGNGIIPFLRYGYQDRELRRTRQLISCGVGVQNPIGRPDDLLGLGFSWGEPVDRPLRDQYVTEAFYRVQLTPKVQVTPGYQVILDPSRNAKQDVVGVFELRVRVVF